MLSRYIFFDIPIKFLIKMRALGRAHSGDKALVELGKIISLSIYENVLIYSTVIYAFLLHEAVAIKQLLRGRTYPHNSLGVLGEKVKLTRSLEDEYPAIYVIG